MATTYQELLDAVAQYYGSGSDQWATIAQYGVNQQTLPIIQQVPGVTVTLSNSGKYLGYDYSNPFASVSNPASAIDSNVQSGAYGSGSFNAQLPATAVTNPSTGTTTLESGSRLTGAGTLVNTIADRASLAIAGVALGTKLGKLIDSGIYAFAPDWWDEHFPSINPETWDDIATTQGGKNFIRSIFGLQNDDMTMYLDERMLAYTYMMLLQNGAYNTGGGSTADIEDRTGLSQAVIDMLPLNVALANTVEWTGQYSSGIRNEGGPAVQSETSTSPVYFVPITRDIPPTQILGLTCSLQPFTLTVKTWNQYGQYTQTITSRLQRVLGQELYIGTYFQNFLNPTSSNVTFNYTETAASVNELAYVVLYGTITTASGLDGVSDNPEAGEQINPNTLINPTTGQPVTPNDNIDDVLQALKTLYPDLFADSIYEDVPQPDGTTQRITYVPTPYPNTTNPTQPTTDTTPGIDPQTNPQINPNIRPETLIQQLIDTLTTDPTPPDMGDGDTPPSVVPSGSANALYSIYNPTQGELNSFGAWLWSSNFVDQLLKLFNDPMQAIIGLHKVFAPPAISGASTIKVGYLDSGVSSNVVGNQYTTIDCGYVDISEYFGNVFDYDPFTQIYIYLPFVGIEKLDTGDVMRGRVGVKYHVDVITGACLAEISVIRDGSGGILYTFTGNCAVQYPISSGSYMGIVASLASIAGGVVGTVASGGALAPVAMGAVSGALNAHTRVQHSGGFSGNAGAMGVKIPYIIITRPQTCLADNFPAFDGYPANKTTSLSACSGFVKCETCHVENVPATDAELSEIEMLLKGGIII